MFSYEICSDYSACTVPSRFVRDVMVRNGDAAKPMRTPAFAYLKDAAEDIYSLADGVSIDNHIKYTYIRD